MLYNICYTYLFIYLSIYLSIYCAVLRGIEAAKSRGVKTDELDTIIKNLSKEHMYMGEKTDVISDILAVCIINIYVYIVVAS